MCCTRLKTVLYLTNCIAKFVTITLEFVIFNRVSQSIKVYLARISCLFNWS